MFWQTKKKLLLTQMYKFIDKTGNSQEDEKKYISFL